jgi:hypothetical protein
MPDVLRPTGLDQFALRFVRGRVLVRVVAEPEDEKHTPRRREPSE